MERSELSISAAADGLVHASSRSDCFASQLPYGEAARTVQVDIVVYDNLHHSLLMYEVKGGNGSTMREKFARSCET